MATDQDVRKWRSSRRYQLEREAFLYENPLCENCLSKTPPQTVPATELHHTKQVKRYPDLFWEVAFWQALCATCHTAESNRQKRRIVGATAKGDLVQ